MPPNVRFFAGFTLSLAFRYSVTFMGPAEEVQQYAAAVRFFFLPVIVLSGFWMWKGHVLRRLISKRSAYHDAAANRPQALRFTVMESLNPNIVC